MSDLKYTTSHEWVRLDGGDVATVGITDHAQTALGDVVFVELPEVGREVGGNEACAVVESVKAASDVYAPVAGRVVEANERLADDPGLVNRDPDGRGLVLQAGDRRRGGARRADGRGRVRALRGEPGVSALEELAAAGGPRRLYRAPRRADRGRDRGDAARGGRREP